MKFLFVDFHTILNYLFECNSRLLLPFVRTFRCYRLFSERSWGSLSVLSFPVSQMSIRSQLTYRLVIKGVTRDTISWVGFLVWSGLAISLLTDSELVWWTIYNWFLYKSNQTRSRRAIKMFLLHSWSIISDAGALIRRTLFIYEENTIVIHFNFYLSSVISFRTSTGVRQ